MEKYIVDEILGFNDGEDRHLHPGEVKALRILLGELEKTTKHDDILGTFARARLRDLPIPLRLWGQGHRLI